MKALVRRLLGDTVVGALDYWRFPADRSSWGGPFNGQLARQSLFEALIAQFRPSVILETGTYRGTTTEFMAATGLPVFTVENNRRLYGFSRMRLHRRRNVKMLWGDSRQVMRDLFAGPLRRFQDEVLFAYLDAHGSHNLPLGEELDIVFGHCPAAVVMIDDFQVPFDSGYGYDKYRSGLALTPSYIEPARDAHGLTLCYPSTPSSEETGVRRGCVVLAKGAEHGRALASLALLRAAAGRGT